MERKTTGHPPIASSRTKVDQLFSVCFVTVFVKNIVIAYYKGDIRFLQLLILSCLCIHGWLG